MRIFLGIIGFVSVFIAPPWLSALCVLVLCIRWRAWEVLLIGAFSDILWFPASMLYGIPLGTLYALLLLIALEPLRNELLVDRQTI